MVEIINVQNLNGQLLVSSREIATNFEKRHNDVVKAIENLTTENFVVKEMFIESTFEHKGNFYKEYLMTRDGFSLLVMGFTGTKALAWKVKYIEAFNKMEEELKNPYGNLSKELQAIIALDRKQQETVERIETVATDFEDFKNNSPLFNVECDEISRSVRNVGVIVLGGKNSEAYRDKSLRAQVYTDIYKELKRQFGVSSYKAIKRGQLHRALEIIEKYEAPIVLQDEIKTTNMQLSIV